MNQSLIYPIDSAIRANGRFSRMSFLAWNCLLGIAVCVIFFILSMIFPLTQLLINPAGISGIAYLLFFIVYIILIYFSFIFVIRRLHDLDKSGWMSLLLLVPIANFFFALYILFARGTQGTNQFGEPRTTSGWEKILAWVYIVLCILSIIATPYYYSKILESSQSYSQETTITQE